MLADICHVLHRTGAPLRPVALVQVQDDFAWIVAARITEVEISGFILPAFLDLAVKTGGFDPATITGISFPVKSPAQVAVDPAGGDHFFIHTQIILSYETKSGIFCHPVKARFRA